VTGTELRGKGRVRRGLRRTHGAVRRGLLSQGVIVDAHAIEAVTEHAEGVPSAATPHGVDPARTATGNGPCRGRESSIGQVDPAAGAARPLPAMRDGRSGLGTWLRA